MLNNTDFLKKFLAMEEESGSIIEHFTTLNGENVWLYMRTMFYANITSQGNFGKLPNNIPVQIKLGLIPFFYKALASVPKNSCIILSYMYLHTEKYRGKLFDPYLDPVFQELSRMGSLPLKILLDCEIPQDAQFIISPLPLLSIPLFCKPWHFTKSFPIKSYSGYQKKCQKFGIPTLSWQNILAYWLKCNSFTNLWKQILSILKPRLVVLECYYSPRNMGMAMACRSLSIPCIEYQHGFQNWPHVPYNLPYIPEHGYDALPEWFFHWGECSAKNMQHYFEKQDFHKCLVAGKPAYIAWKRGSVRDDIREQALDTHLMGRIPIGVALPVGDGEIYAMLEAAISQAPSEWIWLLRSHPVFNVSWAKGWDLKSRFPDRTETMLSSAMPLHSFLQRCHHLVTGHSTTAIEAIALHDMTVSCIHPEAKVFWGKNMTSGEMHFIDSSKALLQNISYHILKYPCQISQQKDITKNENQMIYAFKHVLAYDTAVKKFNI